MIKEDLIKKLEKIKTPSIEIQSHKQILKTALFGSGYFKEKPIIFWTKRLVPASIALALIAVLGFTVINPKLQMARAMEIAKNDPQIQQLMKDYGVEIKEIKLQDGRAFVLLALPEEKLPEELPFVPALEKEVLEDEEPAAVREPEQMFMVYQNAETGEVVEFSGSVAEISFKAKKVEKLEMVETMKFSLTPLTDEEKARAIEIAKTERKIKEMIPDLEEREVIVKLLPPLKLRLDDGMEVASADPNEQKRVNVIFKSDEYWDTIIVNLTTGKVEGAVSYSTSRIERPQSEHPVPIKAYPIYLEPDGIETALPGEEEVKIIFDDESGSKSLEEELKIYRLPDGKIPEAEE